MSVVSSRELVARSRERMARSEKMRQQAAANRETSRILIKEARAVVAAIRSARENMRREAA